MLPTAEIRVQVKSGRVSLHLYDGLDFAAEASVTEEADGEALSMVGVLVTWVHAAGTVYSLALPCRCWVPHRIGGVRPSQWRLVV